MKLQFTLIAIICCLTSGKLCSQSKKVPYRPKIAEFGFESLMDYQTSTNSESFGKAPSEIDYDLLLKSKIAIPVLLKPKEMLAVQLKYYQHRFDFDEEDTPMDFPLYQQLNQRTFTSAGARLLYRRDITQNGKLTLIGGLEARGDQFSLSRNHRKQYFSAIYTYKPSSTKEIGYGLLYNNEMTRNSVIPFFIYNQEFNDKWTLALKLPKSATIRRRINDKSFISAKTEVNGWRYNFSNPGYGGADELILRRADLQFAISYEREIHDWLWFGIDYGYNKNISYYLAETGNGFA